jgi:hypothetical protein
MATVRSEKNRRLVATPYYTKGAMLWDSTGFRHIDLIIPIYHESRRDGNVIQPMVAIDDKDERGCAIRVSGSHRHIRV